MISRRTVITVPGETYLLMGADGWVSHGCQVRSLRSCKAQLCNYVTPYLARIDLICLDSDFLVPRSVPGVNVG